MVADFCAIINVAQQEFFDAYWAAPRRVSGEVALAGGLELASLKCQGRLHAGERFTREDQ